MKSCFKFVNGLRILFWSVLFGNKYWDGLLIDVEEDRSFWLGLGVSGWYGEVVWMELSESCCWFV